MNAIIKLTFAALLCCVGCSTVKDYKITLNPPLNHLQPLDQKDIQEFIEVVDDVARNERLKISEPVSPNVFRAYSLMANFSSATPIVDVAVRLDDNKNLLILQANDIPFNTHPAEVKRLHKIFYNALVKRLGHGKVTQVISTCSDPAWMD